MLPFTDWLFSLMAPKQALSLCCVVAVPFRGLGLKALLVLLFFPPLRLGVCHTAKFDISPIPSKQRASDNDTFYRETQLMYVHVGGSDISVNRGRNSSRLCSTSSLPCAGDCISTQRNMLRHRILSVLTYPLMK